MRFLPASFAVAALLSAYGVAAAYVNVQRLELQPLGGRPELDPLGVLLNAIGLALGVAAFFALGVAVVSRSGAARDALGAGGLAGMLSGAVAAYAQTAFLRDYLVAVVERYADLPQAFVDVFLGVYVTVATLWGAAFGAVVAWLALTWQRARRRQVGQISDGHN